MKANFNASQQPHPIVDKCKKLLNLRIARQLTQSELDYQLALVVSEHRHEYDYKGTPQYPTVLTEYMDNKSKYTDKQKREEWAKVERNEDYKTWVWEKDQAVNKAASNAFWLEEWIATLRKNGSHTEGNMLLEVLNTYPNQVGLWVRTVPHSTYERRPFNIKEVRNGKEVDSESNKKPGSVETVAGSEEGAEHTGEEAGSSRQEGREDGAEGETSTHVKEIIQKSVDLFGGTIKVVVVLASLANVAYAADYSDYDPIYGYNQSGGYCYEQVRETEGARLAHTVPIYERRVRVQTVPTYRYSNRYHTSSSITTGYRRYGTYAPVRGGYRFDTVSGPNVRIRTHYGQSQCMED